MNNSLWIDSSEGKRYEKINSNIRTEYLIVGGGITGVTTAYFLCKKGVKVTLVDGDYIGYGATGRNTGKLTPQHGLIYSKIVKKYDLETAKKYYEANMQAIRTIKTIIDENNIKCDFEEVSSYLFTESEENKDEILEEFNICKEIGIKCEFTMDIPLPIDVKGAIKFEDTAQFNPKKYIDELILEVERLGGKIYEKTSIKELEEGEFCRVITLDEYVIEANKVIICSHFPFYDGLSFYFTRLRPERSYLIAGKYEGEFPKATFINMEKPTRTFRYYTDEYEKLLIVGGESHKVGCSSENHFEILKSYAKKVFNLNECEYQWATEDYITPDHIPYIGYLNLATANVFVATGFAKWGMTNSTVAASIISDLYSKSENEYAEIFKTSRTEGYFTKEFLKNNYDVAFCYIAGKLKKSISEMPKIGEGRIVKLNGNKYGVYRDEKGYLHIIDSTCTHFGCELNWNNTEKTWDCPCHGSRFSIDGNILEGPATIPLNHYEDGINNDINTNIF